MKGIIILGFEADSETSIDTQFPSNICEFLGVTIESLKDLVEQHMKKKMEPNYVELTFGTEVRVASFYSGFSFRHYVGNPNFAICVFLSQDDVLSSEFEGMLRRIAHELLPKREALNFDDILGQYYEMLKNKGLTPYWEEIVEGETSVIEAKKVEEPQVEEVEKEEKVIDQPEEKVVEEPNLDLIEEEDVSAKVKELQNLLDEKRSKIRELTRKYTELDSESTKKSEEIESLKKELSEQYIKLEKWSQQMADLNQHNSKLMDEIKVLNQEVSERDDFLKEKEKQLEELSKKVTGTKDIEEETKRVTTEKENLKNINLNLNSEIEKLENVNRNLKNEISRLKSQITIHLDSITNLKLEVKDTKASVSTKEKETESIRDQIFDLKKEIKVLRRERDHYREIVKKNNLL
ncbi:MAG: hypothetical protein EAX91_10100 [Candidatus Lokiarchaeota archaeon]|nr:hypothetical protein [Candidatus Lokiarchaeota archaeon]